MVMLRSSGVGAEPATRKKNRVDLDTSSEFLSLESASQTKSSRLKRGLDDSSSNTENTPNGHSMVKEEDSPPRRGSLRTRGQTVKHEVSLAKMNGQTKCPIKSPEKEETGEHSTRKSPRLQGDGKASASSRDKQSEADATDEVEEEEASTLKTQFVLRPREEDSSVRRSSRITRYKRNSRNQSVLYNRLITNTAEAVLQKMGDMQKMRRRLRSRDTTEEDLVIYAGAKRKRTSERTDEGSEDPQENENGVISSEEENDEEEGGKNNQADDEDDDDDDDRNEDDEEEDDDDDHDEEDNEKRYDFRQRKAAVRYQAPREEPKTKTIFFKTSRHMSPSRRRYRFSSTGPRSPYNIRRGNRRRHAIHSSDSTSSSSSSSSSSSDDEKFQRRRRKSRNRSVNRCLPMNLLKEDVLGIHKDRMKIGASLADVDPMQIDQTVRFDSIGGLTRHISALKEMVVFPLLYPEVFERFKIQPPRGCLFYGPPGTGKTLVARALANECSQGERKVSFFMRKGADCLSKWVGESERQLRLLFDQAYQMRPSIIFFDEVDGLAPVRSSRQDQIHSSIVSTLLALMDGLDSRGEVVVIGATNRLDSIDPALRRPGRFDREFLFGLPDREARKDILQIHTRQWTPQPSASFLEELADKCVGYCGADMKAVCAEAALCALRRRYPQIYSTSQKLVLDVASISIGSRDFLSAMRKTVPASQRAVSSPAKALTPVVQPLLGAALQTVLGTVSRLFPHAEQGLKRDKRDNGVLPAGVLDADLLHSEDEDSVCINGLSHKAKAAGGFLHFSRSVLNQPTSYRPRLLLAGRPGSGQSSHLAPAVLHALEKFTVYTLDMAVLFGVSTTSPEEACAQMFCEAKRTSPSILYIPHIQRWWDTVGSALRATFLSLLQDIPSFSPILLLATCNVPHSSLFPEVQDLFCAEYGEVLQVQVPTPQERRNFFDDLILNQAAKAPASKKKAVLAALEVLPVAPPLPPRMLTEKEQQRLEEQEEDTLRELRLFLRDVTNRLSQDKRFKAFTKPVDLEEVPDYATVIEQPMDLSTVLSNIDTHKYVTVKEFVHDVDLIWKNCLEYNPDKDPSDRQIRHRACALKDTVQAIVKDELDEDFEKICEDIKESRGTRGCSTSRFAPSYYHVHPKTRSVDAKSTDAAGPSKESTAAAPSAVTTPRPSAAQKKKRRKSRWCNGIIRKRSSPHTSKDHSAVVESGEEEERRGAESEEEEEEEEGGDAAESGLEELEITGAEETPMEQEEPAQQENQDSQPMDKDTKDSRTTEEASQATTEATQPRVEAAVEARAGDQSSEGTQDPVVVVGAQENHILPEGGDNRQPSTTDKTEPQRVEVEEENTTEVGVRRATRGLKYQGMQQVMDVDQEILDQKTKPPVVDHNKLKELLQRAVSKTEGYEVYQLEKLYALLCQSIYRHRKDYDKTALLKEMENEIEDFS
ncbi:ATPase family AAA domain-containing protein 2-like isoform X3 [Salvelinus namaycush]|uniref:ATPase family AAA domain-containing protein 2 n=1 Tax=Salvelinus namaycush TaxID=8040 RepID=A0A8U0TYY7_SALNM|nr:ATPase family AAA domain-containing protein 2-like isoform X3 [Salvelinus namaycush]